MEVDTGGMTLKKTKLINRLLALLAICLLFAGCSLSAGSVHGDLQDTQANGIEIPPSGGQAYEELNNGQPLFSESDYTTEAFELYSDLDELGRCGAAYANICEEIMPTEERGAIGKVKPSGWHTVKYDWVDGKYLYNRCHLIGYQLAGENANEKNLITGTRSFNTQGMLPFENQVADYVKETGNHVLYRVTPVFEGDNLVASGVTMEAYSVEDHGDGVQFHVFVYNVEPGVLIDYATGESREDDGTGVMEDEADGMEDGETAQEGQEREYVLNVNTKRFHLPECGSAEQIKPQNRKEYTGTREELTGQGYQPCGVCKP